MGTPRVGDLEIEQDLEHEERAQRVRRIGWALILLFWSAGLAGLFGSGLLSRSTASAPGLRLEYERFLRYTAPQELTLRLGPSLTSRPQVRVWIDRRYLEGQQVESVVPQPESVEAGADRLVFVLVAAEAGKPTSLTLRLQTQRVGSLEGRIGVIGGAESPPLRFHQFVYP
jgi:hypothetical protein